MENLIAIFSKRISHIGLFILFFIGVCVSFRVCEYLNPEIDDDQMTDLYSRLFNDLQSEHMRAAIRYGIRPIADESEIMRLVGEAKLVRIRSCKDYWIRRLDYSTPYLTPNAADLIKSIGKNFCDSLESRGLADYKIVITSVLRTKDSVERLVKINNVAVKNSAHCYGTTFDISYVRFVPSDIRTEKDARVLKSVLADVLQELRTSDKCYVRYEKSQNCFHVTVRS